MPTARSSRVVGRRNAALAVVSALALASCSIFAGDAAQGGGIGVVGPEVITCDDVTLARDAGRPTNPIDLSGVPSDFGEVPAFEVLDVGTGETFMVPVAGTAGEPGGYFIVPILPSNPVAGGPVELTLLDGEGGRCEPFDFSIEELPEAPGAFEAMVAEVERLHEATGGLFGPWLPPSEPAGGAPDLDLPLEIVADRLKGPDNPNSVARVLDGDAGVSEHMTPEAQRLMDGIVEESGVLEEMRTLADAVSETADPPRPAPGQDGPPSGDSPPPDDSPPGEPPPDGAAPGDGPARGLCERLSAGMSAETLSFLMTSQGRVEQIREKTDLAVTGLGLLNGTVGVISLVATAGVPNPLTVGTGVVGVTLSAYELLADMAEHVLPRELSSIDFDYERERYLEDDEDLAGRWDDIVVTASTSDWNLDGRILDLVLKRASGGVSKVFFKRHTSDAVVKRASDFLHETFTSAGTSAAMAHRSDSAGLVTIPACEVGPVDISDPDYHRASFAPEGEPAVIDGERSLEIVWTGSGQLTVRAEPAKFNGSQAWKEVPVEAAPIEVTIEPPAAEGDPGFVATFTVAVENANDPGIAVTVDPPGGHVVTQEQIGSNLYEITVQTSSERADFPALLRVESTSRTGLRARPDAPPRFATAPIRTQGDVMVTPWATCLEPGASFQLEATVGFANQRVHWDATGGSVDATGRFTAPDEPGQYIVRATADADPSRSATSTITVAETCACWAQFELPARGISQTAHGGHISFGEGYSADMLNNLVFDTEEGGQVVSRFFFGIPPRTAPSDMGDLGVPDGGPVAGQTGRFLVDVSEGIFDPTGRLPRFVSTSLRATPLGGNRYDTSTSKGGPKDQLLQFPHQTHVTVDEFTAVSDREVWLEGALVGTLLVEEQDPIWAAEPVRMRFQGRFVQGAAEEMFPGLGGSLFDAWLCERD